MRDGLAYVLITPYSLAKSRTGGIISRLLSLSGLRLVGARMYAPGDAMVDEYKASIEKQRIDREPKQALLRYIDDQLRPGNRMGLTNRVMLLLLEGANATKVLHERVVGSMTFATCGNTIRGTYGDYVTTPDGELVYFEPAVLISTEPETTRRQLAVFAKYAGSDGGILEKLIRVPKAGTHTTTLVILKPDNFQRQTSAPGNVIDSFSRTGLFIVGAKVLHVSVSQALELYAPLRKEFVERLRPTVQDRAQQALEQALGFSLDEPAAKTIGNALKQLNAEHEFSQVVEYLTGLDPRDVAGAERSRRGRETCLALLYRGPNAVNSIRKTLGATNPQLAEGGTIRHMYGVGLLKNVAHASHTARNAARERKIVDLAVPEQCCEVKEIINAYLRKRK